MDKTIFNRAGVPGFEPGYAGIRNQSLTTWLHPNKYRLHTICIMVHIDIY